MMKKIIYVVLSMIILVSSVGITSFAKDKCDCGYAPVVFVVGQGEDLYLNEGTSEEKLVPDITGNLIKLIPKFVLGYTLQAISGNYKALGALLQSMFHDIVDDIACDRDGNSRKNISLRHEEFDTSGRHSALKYGEENSMPILPCDYKFKYDWRLDPVYNAELLHDYIENVKECTGHDKVIIMAHSEGNNVLCSYLYKYGSESFEKVMFLSPAYQGLSILGSLFSGEYHLGDKGDDLVTFLDTNLADSPQNGLIRSGVSMLNKLGILRIILKDVQKLLDNVYEQNIYDELIDTIGTMPGMWSFCPDEYYERAKHRAFDGKEGYDNLIKKIDHYHYNVQKNVPSIISGLLSDGVVVYIVAGYGISSIPVSNTSPNQSDMVIDTKYMSIGATCSPVAQTFESSYKQKVDDGHNHLSPDMMVDASTCAFPEITFFVRDKNHNDDPTSYCQFLWQLAYQKEQLDVFSVDGYSQFMKYENGRFINVTSIENVEKQSSVKLFFESLLSLFKGK